MLLATRLQASLLALPFAAHAGCQGLCFAGPLSRDLLATTLDGSLLRLSHPSTSPPLLAELQVRQLVLGYSQPWVVQHMQPRGWHALSSEDHPWHGTALRGFFDCLCIAFVN